MMENLFVKSLRMLPEVLQDESYLSQLPVVRHMAEMGRLELASPVTFFVGENGTGKSTLLEAVAVCCGFNPEGGTVNFNFATQETHSGLYNHLRVGRGLHRPKDGFFLRAESFYNVATEVDRLDKIGPGFEDHSHAFLEANYGGRSLHHQSHGESFMALVLNRFGANGLYILDEPEAALSPSRQMALLAAIHGLVQRGSQFIISTHSPILMAYPGAEIYELSEAGVRLTAYKNTGHYTITRRFLENPEHSLRYLLEE